MQWTPDRNGGFSRADPASLVLPAIMDPIYGYEAVNVEAQWRSPYSLLNWVRRMLVVRGRWKAFGRGTIRFLRPQNRKVLAYLREFGGEIILCVANVSRTAQAVELDMSEFVGRTPVELSGEVAFPKIGQLTYLLTLQPFGFYWFSLSSDINQPAWSTAMSENMAEYHTFIIRDGLKDIIDGRQRTVLEEEVLPAYVAQRRWYQNKGGGVQTVAVQDTQSFDKELVFSILEVSGESYALPLVIAWEDAPSSPFESALALARVRKGPRIGLLTDGFATVRFARTILSSLAGGCGPGALTCRRATAFTEIASDAEIEWPGAEQSNSTLIVGRTAVIKLFRRLVEGVHPEAEMVRELTERGFAGIASLMGDITYKNAAVAVVQRFVDNQGDGFSWSLERVGRLIDDKAVTDGETASDFETYRNFIEVVGRRLGEMHTVLAQPSAKPDFAPEFVTTDTIRAWREGLREQLQAAWAVRDLGDREKLLNAADNALAESLGLPLTRIHGDLHLGQVLVAAGDAIIIDFEGEPAKSLAERRAKNSPLRDVAGMLRSFDYVSAVVQRNDKIVNTSQSADRAKSLLTEFGRAARDAFLTGYARGRGRPLSSKEENVLAVFALEKAAYEIVYEANNRPDWIDVPASGFNKLAAAL
jgi:maltose alpha-D-glucosyltransferase/alpha-amylase